MKSFQNWPGSSASSDGGVRRIVRSSKPRSASVPSNDSSTMKTTRWPRTYVATAGRNRLPIAPGALDPVAYRLRVTATDEAGNISKAAKLKVRVR